MTRLLSWNVNGIRAVQRKGFLTWLAESQADIMAVQESRVHPDQLDDVLRKPQGYFSYWVSAQKKGYSGVALFSKTEPLNLRVGIGSQEFDVEGRTLIAEYPNFTLVNGYFPSGSHDRSRIAYKLAYSEAVLEVCQAIRARGKAVILCGDVNIAHRAIDLTHPKANEKNSGFTPEERAWFDKLMAAGYIDSFRHFYPDEAERYTWWTNRLQARQRNVGWRIDYVLCSEELRPALRKAFILAEVMGSDHCPVGIELVD